MKTVIISLLLFICLSSEAADGFEIIYVPDHYASIQEAIDAAYPGDVVVARPDTYHENIDFHGKAIRVRSEIGPRFTVIEGDRTGPVVAFRSGEKRTSVIEGFTIRNGTNGIECFHAAPAIEGNVITGNTTTQSGGGILCTGDYWNLYNILIRGNEITGNAADRGGGIYMADTFAGEITENSVSHNQGGGIYLLESGFRIERNLVKHNRADPTWTYVGGGISCQMASPLITGNVVACNIATGIFGRGGGILCYFEADCLITGNTIADNSAEFYGGGICNLGSSVKVAGTILWGNSAPTGPAIHAESSFSPPFIAMTCCDVEGGVNGVSLEPGSQFQWLPGNIAQPPLFVEPGREDYHLTWRSPCRDRSSDALPGLADCDIEGDPRLSGEMPDIGADEFHLHLYHWGDVVPGGFLDIRLAGRPATRPVLIALGSGLLDVPFPTAWGVFFLRPPLEIYNAGGIGSYTGIRSITVPVPATWSPGDVHPLQALAGGVLTNAHLLEVQ